jgi:hypothetical protein
MDDGPQLAPLEEAVELLEVVVPLDEVVVVPLEVVISLEVEPPVAEAPVPEAPVPDATLPPQATRRRATDAKGSEVRWIIAVSYVIPAHLAGTSVRRRAAGGGRALPRAETGALILRGCAPRRRRGRGTTARR